MRPSTRRAASEPLDSVMAKASELRERADVIKAQALGKLGSGTTWKELEKGIDEWWASMRRRTKADTSFATLYKAGRMTVRAIARDGDAQGGTFKAQVLSGESGTKPGVADMTLERNRASILKRTDPATWNGEKSDRDAKRKTGLYELSASLLNPDRKVIFPQLKFYSTPEAVVFMPASYPEDQQIFAAISELVDADQPKLRAISSEMTRITMAQASDMATKLVDMSAQNDGSDIRYGESGSVVRYKGGEEKLARLHEIEARRLNALQYFNIFDDVKQMRNEVVVEYRKHASDEFPLFTEIDHTNKRFYVLDSKTFVRTGAYIDNLGNKVE